MQLKPKKSLGQNFLIDKNIRRKIISACTLDKDDIVLEIGSGRGELTRDIAAEGVKKIYALELDQRLIPVLKETLGSFTNVEVIHQDILKFNFNDFFKKIDPALVHKGGVKVIGNVPYYITTPIIERLLSRRAKINIIFLTVQKEFAERLAASPGSKRYGSLSCFVQYYAEPKCLFTIRRNSFFPVPKVDSVLLKLEVLASAPVEVRDEKTFFKIIRASFNKRRKTLRNSLEGIVPQEKLEAFFCLSGIDINIRPERLSLWDFACLSNI